MYVHVWPHRPCDHSIIALHTYLCSWKEEENELCSFSKPVLSFVMPICVLHVQTCSVTTVVSWIHTHPLGAYIFRTLRYVQNLDTDGWHWQCYCGLLYDCAYHVHTRTHARTHARTHTHTHTHMHMHMQNHAPSWLRGHARTHARTHTHTHTRAYAEPRTFLITGSSVVVTLWKTRSNPCSLRGLLRLTFFSLATSYQPNEPQRCLGEREVYIRHN